MLTTSSIYYGSSEIELDATEIITRENLSMMTLMEVYKQTIFC